jgi:hypothetical protein
MSDFFPPQIFAVIGYYGDGLDRMVFLMREHVYLIKFTLCLNLWNE